MWYLFQAWLQIQFSCIVWTYNTLQTLQQYFYTRWSELKNNRQFLPLGNFECDAMKPWFQGTSMTKFIQSRVNIDYIKSLKLKLCFLKMNWAICIQKLLTFILTLKSRAYVCLFLVCFQNVASPGSGSQLLHGSLGGFFPSPWNNWWEPSTSTSTQLFNLTF